MKTIWKFDAPTQDEFSLLMPKGAQILSLGLQRGEPKIWALVEPDAPKEERNFVGRGTGHPIQQTVDEKTGCVDVNTYTFIGTVVMLDDNFVYHVFEVNPK